MDIGALLQDSIEYAQEALVGKWTRWATFIILALPFSLVQFVFDPKKISAAGTKMNWDAVPWGQIAVLFGIGLLLSFFLSGYMVRIYRGTKPAPDFTGWTDLFIDGIKLAVVWLLWALPLFIVLAVGAAVAFGIYLSAPAAAPNIALLLLVLLLIVVECVLLVIVMLFGMLGAVRFSRTGSIREGIRFSAILTTIRTMGWLSYILALVVSVVVAVIYAVISGILSLIPYIGWVIVLIIAPFFSILFARYITLVYEQGEPQPVPPVPAE
jgi:hypothetical protein